MSKRLEQRLEVLEKASTDPRQKITRIEFVNPLTGKVMAVMNVGGNKPNGDEVLEVLKHKHATDPPRRLERRIADQQTHDKPG